MEMRIVKIGVLVLVLTIWSLLLLVVAIDRKAIEKQIEECRADVAANEKTLMALKEDLVLMKLRVADLERSPLPATKPKPEMDKERKRKGPLKKLFE
jgi:hypothetical protein